MPSEVVPEPGLSLPRRPDQAARIKPRHDVVLDAAGARDNAGFLALVARTLNSPDYFGGNWDAVEECLADRVWSPGPTRLVITNAGHLDATDPAIVRTFTEIVGSVAATARRNGSDIQVRVEPA